MGGTERVLREYVCRQCGYLYNPAAGVRKPPVPAGIPFEELPDDWQCPVCGAKKSLFSPVEG